MSKKLVCRVCGKEYDGCRSAKHPSGVFQWQAVACSPSCGAIYLDRVMKARNPEPIVTTSVCAAQPTVIEVESVDETEIDEFEALEEGE